MLQSFVVVAQNYFTFVAKNILKVHVSFNTENRTLTGVEAQEHVWNNWTVDERQGDKTQVHPIRAVTLTGSVKDEATK